MQMMQQSCQKQPPDWVGIMNPAWEEFLSDKHLCEIEMQ